MTKRRDSWRTAAMLAVLTMATALAPSQAQTADAAPWRGVLQPAAQARPLDLDDPAQRRAYQGLLRAAGVKDGSPLYRLSGRNRVAASPEGGKAAAAQVFALLGFASDDAGASVSSGVLYATRADTSKITLTLVVTDPEGVRVTYGTAEVADAQSALLVTPKGDNPQRKPLNAFGTASVLYSDGSHEVYYVSGDAASYPTKIDNQAPALNDAAAKNKDVQVCINRATAPDAPPEACNFVLASVDTPPSLQLPVIGSAVFDGDIDVDAGGKPKDATATLAMLAPDGTTQCPFADVGDAFFGDPGTKVQGKTLSWSLDPLRFGNDCAIAAGAYTFALAVAVNVQGQPAWATVTNAFETDTVTARAIPPVQVVAGCIAKGTAVTLAGGATRAVEQLKVGDKLKSEGADLAVAAIASGKRSESVTLTLASGDSVQVSTVHPIPTARGIVQAQDLRLGDELTTSGGSSKVTRIVAEVLPRPLQVYDLVLTPAKASVQQGSTYYAGGIRVGDGAMKAALAEAKANAKEQRP